jgi:hypothetical protein
MVSRDYMNYTSLNNNFGLATFADPGLTIPYLIKGYQVVSRPTYNPFYIGVGAITSSSSSSNLSADPQVVNPVHGGNAFVLSCEVITYDVTYAYVNSSINPASVSATPSNGTVRWNLLGPLTYEQERMSQAIELAGLQNSSSALALSWGNSFSGLSVAMLAGAYDGRTTLQQQTRTVILVTKVLKGVLWALVLCTLAFAIGGACLGVWALLGISSGTAEAQALFSVEQVVGMCFEDEKFNEGGEVEERFEERRIGEVSGRVGVTRRGLGWVLERVELDD